MEYYNIPFRVDQIMKGAHKDDEIDIKESIHQNIHLILKAFTLSYRFDPTFGCIMNKFHAATPPQKQSERIWRESLRESIQDNLLDMFKRYETRVKIQDIIVDMKTPSMGSSNPLVLVKIQVIGQLTLGRKEIFHFPDSEIAKEAQEVFPLMIPVGKGK